MNLRATQRTWFADIPWEKVITINQTFCQTQNTAHIPKANAYERVKGLWQQSNSRSMSLTDACDICRRCQEMAPFEFNNANTFASIGKSIVEPLAKNLGTVEGQIVLSTVTHFIAGMVTMKELGAIIKHFEAGLFSGPAPTMLPVAAPAASSLDSSQPRPSTGGLAA